MNENMCISTSQDLRIIRKIKVFTVNLGIWYIIKKGMFFSMINVISHYGHFFKICYIIGA